MAGYAAPASISLALAVFWFTRTVSGARVSAGAVAVMALPLDACRPSVTTTRAPAAQTGAAGARVWVDTGARFRYAAFYRSREPVDT